jgi:hypothetical protein
VANLSAELDRQNPVEYRVSLFELLTLRLWTTRIDRGQQIPQGRVHSGVLVHPGFVELEELQ